MDPSIVKIVLITALLFALLVIVPIVAILTEHQRKMAAILRGSDEPAQELSESAQILAALGGLSQKAGGSEEIKQLSDRIGALEAQTAELRKALQAGSSFEEPQTEQEP